MIPAFGQSRTRRLRRLRPPRSVRPAGVERRFARAIRAHVAPLPGLVRLLLLPRLAEILAASGELAHPGDSAHADAWGALISLILAGIRVAFERRGANVAGIARTAAREASDANAEQLQRQVKNVLGVDPFRSEPWLGPLLDDATAQSVRLIQDVPERYLTELERLVRDSVRAGRRHEELAAVIRERFSGDSSKGALQLVSRAKFIARDQTAKFTSSLARVRQQQLGVKRYTWRGVLDQREREEHVEREGKVFSWDEPPWDGHPGEPPNCRCVAEPVLEDLLSDDEE